MIGSPHAFDQHGFDVRFGWGPDGLRVLLGGGVGTVVVVDVLSFTTSVDVAVSRDAAVLPLPVEEDAAGYASRHGAVAAVPRGADGWTLSPASLTAVPPGTRLVLPSPNGATLAFAAARSSVMVLAGCLRNALAVGEALREIGGPVAVVAAGERWPDAGTLRPAVEDLLGAGAVVAAMGRTAASPEAAAARAAFAEASADLPGALRRCASGRELIDAGFAEDVEIASAAGSSGTIPVLDGVAFTGIR